MTGPVVAIPRGASRGAERHEQEKAARKSGFNNDWEYLSLKAADDGIGYGESVVIRFVTDDQDIRETYQHTYAKTKPAPADKPDDKKWPNTMGSVCRQAPGFKDVYPDCYICEADEYMKEGKKGMYHPKPSFRLWAVAVEREPMIGTKEMADKGLIEAYEIGSPVGYQDVLVDREVDGETVKGPKFLVLNFGLENFFNSVLGSYNAYGTLLDRDYKVTRKGSGTDTEYIVAPLDKQKHTDGKPFDLRRADLAEQYKIPFNLDAIIANLASDDYYEWFFDRRVESSWAKRFPNKDDGDSGSSAEEKAAEDAASRETIEKMRDRFRANK